MNSVLYWNRWIQLLSQVTLLFFTAKCILAKLRLEWLKFSGKRTTKLCQSVVPGKGAHSLCMQFVSSVHGYIGFMFLIFLVKIILATRLKSMLESLACYKPFGSIC